MSAHWYVIRSKPRKEEALHRHIQSQGFEAYYPYVRVNPVNPRAAKRRAYFPSYLFVLVDIEETGTNMFQWMPFSQGLVTFDAQPAPVPIALIEALRQRLNEINAKGGLNFEGLEPGVPVRVASGPFAGHQAIFDARLPGSERVRVLLQIISGRQLPVELPVGQIELKSTS